MRKKSIVLFILLVLSIVSAIFILNIKSETPTEEATPSQQLNVSLVSHSTLFLPFYVALEKNVFASYGLEVSVATCTSQWDAYNTLLAGETDIILTGPEIVFFHLQQDKTEELVIIAPASNANCCFLLTRKNDKPFDWNDLKGKVVIGHKNGELPQIVFEHILRQHNLRPFVDVHIINNLPPEMMLGSFQAGTGQYIVLSEPLASLAESSNIGHIVASLELADTPLVTNVFLTTSEFLSAHRTACQKFIKAYRQGIERTKELFPEEITLSVQEHFPALQSNVLLKAVSRCKSGNCWPSNSCLSIKELTNLQDVLLKGKEINEKIPVRKIPLESFPE